MELTPFRLLGAAALVGLAALILLLVQSKRLMHNEDAHRAADFYSMSVLFVWLVAALVVFLRHGGRPVRPYRMLLAGLIYQGRR